MEAHALRSAIEEVYIVNRHELQQRLGLITNHLSSELQNAIMRSFAQETVYKLDEHAIVERLAKTVSDYVGNDKNDLMRAVRQGEVKEVSFNIINAMVPNHCIAEKLHRMLTKKFAAQN